MAVQSLRDAYVAPYRELLETTLNAEVLERRIADLTTLCEAYISEEDASELRDQNEDIREYIERRLVSVREQLDGER